MVDAASPHRPQALPLLAGLLGWAVGGTAAGGGFQGADGERQLQWALAGGLGPLLHRASQAGEGRGMALPAAWKNTLLSADLSARVRHGALVDTLLALIDTCRELGVALTLLKGISVSEQWYPEEHLRPMGDIDVLLHADDYARVEAALLARGCEQVDEPLVAGRQHGIPLRDEARGTIIELHTRLFALGTELSQGTLFGPANLARHARASRYHDQPVHRLSPELQLVYIASAWFDDLSNRQVQPSYLPSLFDAVYLLAAAGATLDWPGLLASLDNPMATASLHVMLSYLPRHGVCGAPPEIAAQLAARQSLVGPLQLRLIHRMLDRHLIAGRPWSSRLPPPMPGRYSFARQWRKRVLHQH